MPGTASEVRQQEASGTVIGGKAKDATDTWKASPAKESRFSSSRIFESGAAIWSGGQP